MTRVSELTATAATRKRDWPHRLAVRSDERSDATARSASSRPAATWTTLTTRTAAGAPAARALLTGTCTGSLSRILLRHVAARSVHHVERERPEVVSSLVLVDPDRRLGALAGDAHDAAADETTLLTRLALRRRRAAAAARLRRCGAAWLRRCGAAWLRRCGTAWLPLSVADRNRAELAIRRHRIFVLLPEVASLHEDVEARREVVSVLGSKEGDRTSVLFSPKRQLRFLFTTGKMAPGGQRHGHEDGHDGEADEQRRHRITPLVFPTLLTV